MNRLLWQVYLTVRALREAKAHHEARQRQDRARLQAQLNQRHEMEQQRAAREARSATLH